MKTIITLKISRFDPVEYENCYPSVMLDETFEVTISNKSNDEVEAEYGLDEIEKLEFIP